MKYNTLDDAFFKDGAYAGYIRDKECPVCYHVLGAHKMSGDACTRGCSVCVGEEEKCPIAWESYKTIEFEDLIKKARHE